MLNSFQNYFSSIAKKLLFCFCLLQFQNVFAQNLVPNGNFEVYSSLNIGYGDLYRAVGWDNVNGVIGLNPPFASPDYHNSLGTILNFWQPITAISGNGQAGFCTFQDSIPGLYGYDFREYISCNLTSALIPNKKYKVSFSLTNGGNTMHTNHIGVHFSTSPLYQMTYKVIPVVPQIDISTVMYLTGIWQTYSFDYFPQGSYSRITIGNFFNDFNTQKANYTYYAYYFIDSITISAANYPVFANNCLGDSSSFNLADTTNLLSVNWIFGDTISGLNNFSTSINPKHYYQNPGTYSVQSINHYPTFTDTFNFNITIYPPPQITLGNDTVLCNGGSIILNAGNNFDSYLWSDGSTLDSLIINNTGTYYVNVTSNNCTNSDTILVSNLSVNLGNDTLICIGDSIILHAGIAFQNYLWNDGSTEEFISVNQQGLYSVIASANGCQIADSINVLSTNCSVQSSFTSLDTSLCQNTCTNFYDLTSNNPTSWLWNFSGADSAYSNLQNPVNICYSQPGNYDVTLITCNNYGCDTLILTSFIHVDSIPYVYMGSDTLICDFDSITLDAGIGFSSYLWSNGLTTQQITVSSQGIYSVEIISGACVASDTIIVTTQSCALPFISFASTDTNFCEKNCIDFFDFSLNNPISWQWNFTNATPDTSTLQNPANICYNTYGNFDVSLIVCNQFGCDTLMLGNFITCYQKPVDSIWVVNDTLFSLPASSYQWYEITSGLISGATSQYYVPLQQGSFYCIITDSNGCQSSSNVIAITSSSLISVYNKNAFIIYPNPVTDYYLHIDYLLPENQSGTFQLIDINGRIAFEYNLPQGSIKHKLTLPQLANGIYNATIISGNERMNKTIAVIKQ